MIASDGGFNWSAMHIVGTCKNLEKDYFRLTKAPDSTTIRPQRVLEKSLALVKRRWIAEKHYWSTCQQMKSIRQDLTVQNIRNNFTVAVYEMHARLALENKDHEEFNQCQTQLIALYNEGCHGNISEFTAYRILYYIFTDSKSDLITIKASLSPEMCQDPVIKHALDVQAAYGTKNFHRFFKLFKQAPKMSGWLMDWFVERVRSEAFRIMIKAYRPYLSVAHISKELGYRKKKECRLWLKEKNITLVSSDSIDCKQSMQIIASH